MTGGLPSAGPTGDDPAGPPDEPKTEDVSVPLMDIGQTAERLGVSPRFARRLVAERRIPHYKLGHYIRFDRAEVNEWLREQRRADGGDGA